MKKFWITAAAGILSLGLLAQAPATAPKAPKTGNVEATQNQQGTNKPATTKKHHKHAVHTAKPAATPAPAK